MTLTVFNTRTHTREPFTPLVEGQVGMYVCGPTVYDYSHIGHARSYVTYDVMKRYFLSLGWTVTHVQNFTDIDERIAQKARERGITPAAFAQHYIDAFFEDMDRLRVLRATHYPRVSEHVNEMLAITECLVKSDRAYPVDGTESRCDVFFDVTTAPAFGGLMGRDLKQVSVDAPQGLAGGRRHPLDFAVWKAKDDLGVTWDSPWGPGRPGWHIQCTAMATKYLGPTFDLHGGGLDLIFPHHESETAVAESWTGKRYCTYYLHNGFVTLRDEKMSKSTGNFVTVRGLLEKHEPEALRLFLLTAPYRDTLDYSEADVHEAAARLSRWRTARARLRTLASAPGEPDATARARFTAALENDFDFRGALAAVDEAVARAEGARDAAEAAALLGFLGEAGRVLGLLWDDQA